MAKKGFGFDHLVSQAAKQQQVSEEKNENFLARAKKNIVIYEEFKFLVPPLAPDELHKLELSILAEGCRDPLVLWHKYDGELEGDKIPENEEWILIDGHNRYQICQQKNLDFKVARLEFPDHESAVNWIVNNQLGKRNVTEETKSYLRGLQYNREKKKETNWQNLRQYAHTEHTEDENTSPTGSTAERLGELHKVSEKTIKRDEKFAIAIDKICGNNRTLKANILQRNIQVPKLKLIEIADDAEETLAQLGVHLEEGLSFGQAFAKVYPEETLEIKDYEQHVKEKMLKGIKKNILQSLDTALKTRDKAHLAALREYLAELENTL
jgi:hypothetical protein